MPWGKNKSYSFSESSSKEKKTQSKEHLTQKNLTATDRPKQISESQETKTGKLSRIL